MKQLVKRELESVEALQCAASAESKLLLADEKCVVIAMIHISCSTKPCRIEQLTRTLAEKEPCLEQLRHLQEECVDHPPF